MLKLSSLFVLQVLPYLLIALAAVVLLPGVAESLIAAALHSRSSPSHEIGTVLEPFEPREATLDLIRRDHAAFTPNHLLREIAKADDFEDR